MATLIRASIPRGPAAYDLQPGWQASLSNITTSCARRAVGDVSADANPSAGVAVYDSFTNQGEAGWLVFGGTSVASPIIASTYALAGNAATAGTGASVVLPRALVEVLAEVVGVIPPASHGGEDPANKVRRRRGAEWVGTIVGVMAVGVAGVCHTTSLKENRVGRQW